MKKQHPILFSTEMVKTILEGRKTQTRRTVKFSARDMNHLEGEELAIEPRDVPEGFQLFMNLPLIEEGKEKIDNWHYQWNVKCPYGKVGDVLWVRETISYYRGFGQNIHIPHIYLYRADLDYCNQCPALLPGEDEIIMCNVRENWKPSIHMPKAAARIYLEIINIKCEKLFAISEEDALAEGVIYCSEKEEVDDMFYDYGTGRMNLLSSVSSFHSLYEYINGKIKDYPLVWCIEFKVIDKPE